VKIGAPSPSVSRALGLPSHQAAPRYANREKLCLRGTTDYRVNALDGAHFFCVTKAIDPRLEKMF